MDITTMKHVAPSETRCERPARPQATYCLVSPVGVSLQGMTLPVVGRSVTGAHAGADLRTNALTYPTIDAFSFRHRRPPV